MNRKIDMEWLQKYVAILMLLAILLPIASAAITYPTLNGYVTDNANIITPEYREKITSLADKINKETTVEIAVLTIDSLEGDSPENYAVQTFRQNGVGKKDNNNGLLILVAKNDRKYRFEVGYGLESTIPDAMKVPIGDKIITPNFRNEDYGKGIYESMLVIEGLATNNTEVLSKYGLINSNINSGSGGTGGGADSGIFVIMLFVVFGIIAVVFVLMMRNNTRNNTRNNRETYSPPSSVPYIPPTTYRPSPMRSSDSSRSTSSSSSSSNTRRSSSYSSYGGSSHSHSSSTGFGGGFGGFGGGRSGGGGFGGGW
jgi:uncharacterized protein